MKELSLRRDIEGTALKRENLRSKEVSPFYRVLLNFVGSLFSPFCLYCITLSFKLYLVSTWFLHLLYFRIPAAYSFLDSRKGFAHILNKDNGISFPSVRKLWFIWSPYYCSSLLINFSCPGTFFLTVENSTAAIATAKLWKSSKQCGFERGRRSSIQFVTVFLLNIIRSLLVAGKCLSI